MKTSLNLSASTPSSGSIKFSNKFDNCIVLKRAQQIIRKESFVQKVKDDHNGPITSIQQLEELCVVSDEKRMLEIFIFYQRDVIYCQRAVVDKAVFKVKYKNDNDKIVFKPFSTLKDNLIELLSPESFIAPVVPQISDEEFKKGAEEIVLKMSSKSKSTSSSALKLKEGEFIATIWDVEGLGKGWYLGMISRLIEAKDCLNCSRKGFQSLNPAADNPCLEIRSLTPATNQPGQYQWLDDEETHCIYYQVITHVNMMAVRNNLFTLIAPSTSELDKLLKDCSMYKDL